MKKNVKGSVVKATSLGLAAVMASTPITAFAEEAPAEVPVAENPAPEAEVIVAAPAVSEQAAEVAEDVKETAENVENIVPNAVPYLTNPAPNGEGEVVEEDPIDKPILVKPEQIEIHLVGEVKKVTDSEQDPVEYVPGLAEEVEKVAELDEDAEDKAASAENSEEVAAGAANDADKAADAAAASLSQADINAANELIKTAKDALTTAENERTAAEEAVTAAQTALNELLVANGLDPEDETLDVTKLDGNAKKAYDEAMAVLNSAKADRDQKVKFENICKAAYGKKLAEVNRAFGDVAQKQAVYDTVSGVADTLDEAYEDALEEANQANLELKVAQHKAYWDKLAEDKKLADAQKKEREAVIAASRAYENYQKAMAAEKTAQAVYDKTALLKAQEELEAAMKAAGFKNEWQIPSVKDAEEALERANDAVTAAEEAERKAWGDLWNAMRAAGIKRIDKVMDPTQAAAAKKAAEDKLTELQGKKTIADGEKNSALQDLKDAKDAVTDLSDQISEIGLEGLKTDSDAADAEVTRLNNEIATERAKLVDDKEAVTNVTNLEAKEAQYTVGQEKQSVADAASAVNQLRNDVTALENAASNAEREASDKRNKAQEYREIAQDLNHDGGWFDGWDGYGYDPAKAQLYLDEANRLETEANAKSAEAATNRQTVDTKKQEATAKEEGIRNALLAAAKDAGVKVDRTPVVIGDTKYTYGEYKLVKTRYGYALQCYITVSVYNSWTHQYDDNVPWARDIGEKIIFTQGQYNEQNSKLQSQLTSARETLSGIQSANEGVNTTISGLQGQLVTALTTQTEKNAAYQTAYDLINGTDGLNSQLEAARGQQESAQTAYDRKKDAADAIDTAIGKINRNIKRNGKQWAAGIALGALQSAQATLKNARLDAAIAGAKKSAAEEKVERNQAFDTAKQSAKDAGLIYNRVPVITGRGGSANLNEAAKQLASAKYNVTTTQKTYNSKKSAAEKAGETTAKVAKQVEDAKDKIDNKIAKKQRQVEGLYRDAAVINSYRTAAHVAQFFAGADLFEAKANLANKLGELNTIGKIKRNATIARVKADRKVYKAEKAVSAIVAAIDEVRNLAAVADLANSNLDTIAEIIAGAEQKTGAAQARLNDRIRREREANESGETPRRYPAISLEGTEITNIADEAVALAAEPAATTTRRRAARPVQVAVADTEVEEVEEVVEEAPVEEETTDEETPITIGDEETPLAGQEKSMAKTWMWIILLVIAAITGKAAYDKKNKKGIFADKTEL